MSSGIVTGMDSGAAPSRQAERCSPDELMHFTLLTSPSVVFPTIMLVEAIRTIRGEMRMLLRIVRRRRPNIAEMLFFSLKYLAIFAVIGHLLIQYSKGWLSARGCTVMHWLSSLSIFLCSSLVTLTLAFRCYIIFERKRRIGWSLLCLVAIQLAASMTLAAALEKYNALNEPGGYCVWRDTARTVPPIFQFNFYYVSRCRSALS
ncbi:hypothetical protein BCV69DRAFT_52216 [Microstroma glucosiphilum]|uniref:Uncharacterized protein n=1 Tax=Pseudomicrostroma glucosiphilum TaxID=1684307 RepID=A0A316U222_9BASI|nr:hypothetical protein BCV69DRAFT_52216 [Pseudomicrostroma glucosiphilum]PWN18878.1 hypothetical protein BCV69DRAFT_52216 [Pseudomicrostroma glucosiphilum]